MSALSLPDPGPCFRAASELTLRPIDWLWPGRLALGELAVLEGDPGLGKSFVAALPAHIDVLEQVVARTGTRLLVIDPVMQFLGSAVNAASDPSIRRALEPLADLARRRTCAVLMIRHLNKSEGHRALYRGLGSVGLVSVCRSGWLVGEDPAGTGRRVLAQNKSNLAAPQPSLAFEVTQPPGGEALLHWLGPVALTAEDLVCRVRRAGRKPTKRRSAASWLNDLLAAGPMKVSDIWDRALRDDLSASTVRDAAKQELHVRSVRVREDGRHVTYWRLPDQAAPGEKRDAEMDEIDRQLREMERQFPSRTPLEDPEV
jgi:hypothetical protein